MRKPRHTLYTLIPWKEGEDGPFYCPACAEVEGFLYYSPRIREEIEIVALEFPRPREKLCQQLGQENQDCPVLVLNGETAAVRGVTIRQSLSTGKKFINDPREICVFLAETCGGIKPHP